jgi:xanthine dehydrogenase accessory factor
MAQFYEQLLAALAEGEPFALGIICGIKGSSPQKQGAKALFFADGRIVGTLGGGCLEAEIQDRARRALLTRQPATFDLVLDHDFGWDDGLICGGKVQGVILPRAAEAGVIWQEVARRQATRTWGVRKDFSIRWTDRDGSEIGAPGGSDCEWLYQETVSPPCALWIAGSGHVAQAVAPMALQLDFEVMVFDDRPTFASRAFFPEAVRLRVGAWDELLREPLPSRPLFGLVVTRGHQRDALVLASWVQQPFDFLGMIGSRRKARLIFDQFMEDKIASREQLAKVACPVGLDIDSRTVPEIAVSIVAQLVQKRASLVAAPETRTQRAKSPTAKAGLLAATGA